MTDSKDTQEEKPQPDLTILPSCLNLDVLRKEQGAQSNKDLGKNVELYCTKMSKDKGTGEKPTCSNYSCISEPTSLNCSAINSIQTYYAISCPKEGQKPLKSLKCRAKSSEDLKIIDLCCPPEVLDDKDIKDLLATEKPQLSTVDPQNAVFGHQTLKTPRHHQTSRRKIRSSQERRNLGSPSLTSTSLFLHTNPHYQCPRLGQESSQGWVTALGVLGAVGFLVVLGVWWWKGRRARRGQREKRRGQREKRRSHKKTLRAEEGLGEGQDGDGDGDGGTPGMRNFGEDFVEFQSFQS